MITVTVAISRITLYEAEVEFRRRFVTAALEEVHGNRTHAAQTLGIPRSYLQRIIRDLHVAVPGPPPGRPSVRGD